MSKRCSKEMLEPDQAERAYQVAGGNYGSLAEFAIVKACKIINGT